MHPTSSSPAWRWPRLKRNVALVLFAVYAGMGLWRGIAEVLDHWASGSGTPWGRPLVWELTSHLVTWMLLPLAQTVALNARWRRGRWLRAAGLVIAGMGLFWVLHVTGMWATRSGIYLAMGWGPYEYGDMAYRAPMEGLRDAIGFGSLVLAFQAWEVWREKQARELAMARLETELREARLQALAAQLDPHFLFNALNTLSSVIYEDVPKADSLISDLGLMLRDNLQAEGPTWSLQRELDHLGHYLAFVRARFGDRVRVDLEVAPGLGAQPVPRFALQRLVENALKHNEGEAGRTLHIAITGRLEPGATRLRVADDGVGFTAAETQGLGLENLRRSLSLLHGGQAALMAGNQPEGGAAVELILPREGGNG